MATIKQKLAFKRTLENKGNVSKAMRAVGYSPAMAKNPQYLTESIGFQELLETVGLTDELLTKALVDDIKKKKGNRKAELELGFKVRGRLKDNPPPNGDTYNFIIADDQKAAIIRRAAARLSGSEIAPDRLSDSDEPEV